MLTDAAKQSVTHCYQKNYIPCWDEECQQLYEHHTAATHCEGSEDTANILIKRLDEKRQERWIETVESIDFTHSSRKTWHTINHLTGRTASKPDKCPMTPWVLTQLYRSYSKMVVLPTQTETSQDKSERT